MNLIDDQFEDIKNALISFVNGLIPKIGDIFLKLKDSAISLVNIIKDFFVGIIVAIYFLLDKEHFQAQMKKVVYAIFPQRFSEGFFRVCDHTNRSLSGFISGKIIDSIIIGILCFICMTIMQLDYTLLISVIVGVTNIIPVFGPFFGAIPSALLLLMTSPKQVIPFVILIIVLQQLDGNVIGPKILGSSTGLSAFWVMFAILLGGGLFGFGGMLLGVPIFAVIYSLIEEFINFLLERKNMSTNTADYAVKPVKTDASSENNPAKMKSFRLYDKRKAEKQADSLSEDISSEDNDERGN
jgi:predicted PurR-regulated permease PerM